MENILLPTAKLTKLRLAFGLHLLIPSNSLSLLSPILGFRMAFQQQCHNKMECGCSLEVAAKNKLDKYSEAAAEAGPSKCLPKTKKTLQSMERPRITKLRRERCEKIRLFLKKQMLATGLSIGDVLSQSLSRSEVIFG